MYLCYKQILPLLEDHVGNSYLQGVDQGAWSTAKQITRVGGRKMETYQYVVFALTFGFVVFAVVLYVRDRISGRKSPGGSVNGSPVSKRQKVQRAKYQIGPVPLAWRIGKQLDD